MCPNFELIIIVSTSVYCVTCSKLITHKSTQQNQQQWKIQITHQKQSAKHFELAAQGRVTLGFVAVGTNRTLTRLHGREPCNVITQPLFNQPTHLDTPVHFESLPGEQTALVTRHSPSHPLKAENQPPCTMLGGHSNHSKQRINPHAQCSAGGGRE